MYELCLIHTCLCSLVCLNGVGVGVGGVGGWMCACVCMFVYFIIWHCTDEPQKGETVSFIEVVCSCMLLLCVGGGVGVCGCGCGCGGGLCACVCMFVYSIIWHCTDEPQKGETASFIEVVCSCMLLLHPAPTCADAGPSGTDLCTLHLWSTIQAEFLNALCPLPAYSAVSR